MSEQGHPSQNDSRDDQDSTHRKRWPSTQSGDGDEAEVQSVEDKGQCQGQSDGAGVHVEGDSEESQEEVSPTPPESEECVTQEEDTTEGDDQRTAVEAEDGRDQDSPCASEQPGEELVERESTIQRCPDLPSMNPVRLAKGGASYDGCYYGPTSGNADVPDYALNGRIRSNNNSDNSTLPKTSNEGSTSPIESSESRTASTPSSDRSLSPDSDTGGNRNDNPGQHSPQNSSAQSTRPVSNLRLLSFVSVPPTMSFPVHPLIIELSQYTDFPGFRLRIGNHIMDLPIHGEIIPVRNTVVNPNVPQPTPRQSPQRPTQPHSTSASRQPQPTRQCDCCGQYYSDSSSDTNPNHLNRSSRTRASPRSNPSRNRRDSSSQTRYTRTRATSSSYRRRNSTGCRPETTTTLSQSNTSAQTQRSSLQTPPSQTTGSSPQQDDMNNTTRPTRSRSSTNSPSSDMTSSLNAADASQSNSARDSNSPDVPINTQQECSDGITELTPRPDFPSRNRRPTGQASALSPVTRGNHVSEDNPVNSNGQANSHSPHNGHPTSHANSFSPRDRRPTGHDSSLSPVTRNNHVSEDNPVNSNGLANSFSPHDRRPRNRHPAGPDDSFSPRIRHPAGQDNSLSPRNRRPTSPANSLSPRNGHPAGQANSLSPRNRHPADQANSISPRNRHPAGQDNFPSPCNGHPTDQANSFSPRDRHPTGQNYRRPTGQANSLSPRDRRPTGQDNSLSPVTRDNHVSEDIPVNANGQANSLSPRDRRPTGQDNSFSPRDRRPTGQDDSFSPRDRRPTGQDDSFSPRDRRPTGENDSLSPRDRRPTGQDDSFSPRDRRPTGQDNSFSPRDRCPTGENDSLSPRDRRPTGENDSLSPRDRRPTGQNDSLSARDRRPTGQDYSLSPRDRRPTGQDNSFSPRDRRPTGQDNSFSPRDRRPTGQDKSFSSRDRRPTDQDDTLSPRDRRPTGPANSFSPRDRRPTGQNDSRSPRDRRPTGLDDSLSPRDRLPTGQDDSLSPRNRRPTGQDDTLSPRDRRPTGPANSFSPRDRRPTGPANSFSPRDRRPTGHNDSRSPRDRRPTGLDDSLSPRDRLPTGQDDSLSPRNRRPTGQDDTLSPRDRRPTGPADSFSPRDRRPTGQNDSRSPRNRRPTGQDDSLSPRDRRPTGQNDSRSPRDRRPTGLDDSLSPRDRLPTGQDDSLSPRNRRPTGQDDTLSPRDRRPTGPADSFSPRNRRPTGQDDSLSPRDRRPTGQDDILSPRDRRPTGQDDSLSPKNRRPTGQDDSLSPRNRRPTGQDDTLSPHDRRPTGPANSFSPRDRRPTGQNDSRSPRDRRPTGQNDSRSPRDRRPTGQNDSRSPRDRRPTGQNDSRSPRDRRPTGQNDPRSPRDRRPTGQNDSRSPRDRRPTGQDCSLSPVTLDNHASEYIPVNSTEQANSPNPTGHDNPSIPAGCVDSVSQTSHGNSVVTTSQFDYVISSDQTIAASTVSHANLDNSTSQSNLLNNSMDRANSASAMSHASSASRYGVSLPDPTDETHSSMSTSQAYATNITDQTNTSPSTIETSGANLPNQANPLYDPTQTNDAQASDQPRRSNRASVSQSCRDKSLSSSEQSDSSPNSDRRTTRSVQSSTTRSTSESARSGQPSRQSSGQSTGQSSGQSSNQSSRQSSNQSSRQSSNQSSRQSPNQSSRQSSNQSSRQSPNQSSRPSSNQSSRPSSNQSSRPSSNQSSRQSSNQSSRQSSNQSSRQSPSQSSRQSPSQSNRQSSSRSTRRSPSQPTTLRCCCSPSLHRLDASINQSRRQSSSPPSNENSPSFQTDDSRPSQTNNHSRDSYNFPRPRQILTVSQIPHDERLLGHSDAPTCRQLCYVCDADIVYAFDENQYRLYTLASAIHSREVANNQHNHQATPAHLALPTDDFSRYYSRIITPTWIQTQSRVNNQHRNYYMGGIFNHHMTVADMVYASVSNYLQTLNVSRTRDSRYTHYILEFVCSVELPESLQREVTALCQFAKEYIERVFGNQIPTIPSENNPKNERKSHIPSKARTNTDNDAVFASLLSTPRIVSHALSGQPFVSSCEKINNCLRRAHFGRGRVQTLINYVPESKARPSRKDRERAERREERQRRAQHRRRRRRERIELKRQLRQRLSLQRQERLRQREQNQERRQPRPEGGRTTGGDHSNGENVDERVTHQDQQRSQREQTSDQRSPTAQMPNSQRPTVQGRHRPIITIREEREQEDGVMEVSPRVLRRYAINIARDYVPYNRPVQFVPSPNQNYGDSNSERQGQRLARPNINGTPDGQIPSLRDLSIDYLSRNPTIRPIRRRRYDFDEVQRLIEQISRGYTLRNSVEDGVHNPSGQSQQDQSRRDVQAFGDENIETQQAQSPSGRVDNANPDSSNRNDSGARSSGSSGFPTRDTCPDVDNTSGHAVLSVQKYLQRLNRFYRERTRCGGSTNESRYIGTRAVRSSQHPSRNSDENETGNGPTGCDPTNEQFNYQRPDRGAIQPSLNAMNMDSEENVQSHHHTLQEQSQSDASALGSPTNRSTVQSRLNERLEEISTNGNGTPGQENMQPCFSLSQELSPIDVTESGSPPNRSPGQSGLSQEETSFSDDGTPSEEQLQFRLSLSSESSPNDDAELGSPPNPIPAHSLSDRLGEVTSNTNKTPNQENMQPCHSVPQAPMQTDVPESGSRSLSRVNEQRERFPPPDDRGRVSSDEALSRDKDSQHSSDAETKTEEESQNTRHSHADDDTDSILERLGLASVSKHHIDEETQQLIEEFSRSCSGMGASPASLVSIRDASNTLLNFLSRGNRENNTIEPPPERSRDSRTQTENTETDGTQTRSCEPQSHRTSTRCVHITPDSYRQVSRPTQVNVRDTTSYIYGILDMQAGLMGSIGNFRSRFLLELNRLHFLNNLEMIQLFSRIDVTISLRNNDDDHRTSMQTHDGLEQQQGHQPNRSSTTGIQPLTQADLTRLETSLYESNSLSTAQQSLARMRLTPFQVNEFLDRFNMRFLTIVRQISGIHTQMHNGLRRHMERMGNMIDIDINGEYQPALEGNETVIRLNINSEGNTRSGNEEKQLCRCYTPQNAHRNRRRRSDNNNPPGTSDSTSEGNIQSTRHQDATHSTLHSQDFSIPPLPPGSGVQSRLMNDGIPRGLTPTVFVGTLVMTNKHTIITDGRIVSTHVTITPDPPYTCRHQKIHIRDYQVTILDGEVRFGHNTGSQGLTVRVGSADSEEWDELHDPVLLRDFEVRIEVFPLDNAIVRVRGHCRRCGLKIFLTFCGPWITDSPYRVHRRPFT